MIESNSENEWEISAMNKKKAANTGGGADNADFKLHVNKLLKELEDEDDEEDDILAELKKLQEIDPEAIEQEVKKR